ncbi:hypothetical protein EVG20_g775 [Dentipellis fragilis]|uniref:Uncharacterized protein n=1 Tax=Dentipellis fragilis TaxID=205917 RepID=A0A4Y9ZFK6_9AGAM|nr:hypothetical protein EVG20_g775 [Dentipellis fragilis]
MSSRPQGTSAPPDELRRGDRVREIFGAMQMKHRGRRTQLELELEALQVHPLLPDWRERVRGVTTMLRAFVAYVQADWQWTLASAGLNEDDWKTHGHMTNQELYDFIALMGSPDSGDVAQEPIPVSGSPRAPRPRVRVQHDGDKVRVRITARVPDIRGPNISRTPDGDVEVTTLPILTSDEHSYLVSAGFLLALDEAAQALESTFAWRQKRQHEHAANESRRAPAKGSAPLQRSRTSGSGTGAGVDLAQADSKLFDEVRAEHVREIQTIYRQRKGEFKLLGVARERGLDLFAEDLMTLTKRNFGEEVDWIRFDVDRQMMPTIVQDHIEYAERAHRPGLERNQYFDLYRQRQARVEERRAQKESMIWDRVVVEMRKYLGIGTLLPQPDTADEPELDPEVQRRVLEARYPQFGLEREKKGPAAVSGLAHSSSAKDRRGVERPQDEGNQPESSAMAQRRWANPPNSTQAQPHKRWIPPPPSV